MLLAIRADFADHDDPYMQLELHMGKEWMTVIDNRLQ